MQYFFDFIENLMDWLTTLIGTIIGSPLSFLFLLVCFIFAIPVSLLAGVILLIFWILVNLTLLVSKIYRKIRFGKRGHRNESC